MEKSDASLQLEEAQEPQFTLRDYAKHRLMEDMILAVRKAEKSNSSYLILVLDDHTKELFAGIWNLFEIMSKNVFQLERLELKRKEFPWTAAIYFISPTIKSVNNLISDFDKPDNPQYASAHVFFSSKLSDKLMKEMSECKGLVERVKTLTELNVDLNLYSDNIYHLDMNDSLNLYNMNLKDKGTDMYLNKIALQIFTAWAVLNEKPYIQYYGNSKISEIVSRSLVRHFEEFKIRAPGYEFKEPRAKLLILDRSFDMTSPLLHDYSYECLVYETVDSRDQADEICSAGPSKDPHGQSEKILNENDLVWRRFKNEHFAKVMVGISNEISRFVQENKNINAIKKGDGLEVSDMKDVLTIIKLRLIFLINFLVKYIFLFL